MPSSARHTQKLVDKNLGNLRQDNWEMYIYWSLVSWGRKSSAPTKFSTPTKKFRAGWLRKCVWFIVSESLRCGVFKPEPTRIIYILPKIFKISWGRKFPTPTMARAATITTPCIVATSPL